MAAIFHTIEGDPIPINPGHAISHWAGECYARIVKSQYTSLKIGDDSPKHP